MSSTPSSDPNAASEAMKLEAVISREREEGTETRRDSNQAARDETEDDEAMKKAKKSKYISSYCRIIMYYICSIMTSILV